MVRKQSKPVNTEPEFRRLPLGMIDEPPRPIREAMDDELLQSLAASIGEIGVTNPIYVIPAGKRWEIVAGHRRFLASRIAGKVDIPAMCCPSRDVARHAIMLHENVEREELTAAEEGIFFAELMEQEGMDEEKLIRAVRKSGDYIADRLRLLRGDAKVFEALRLRQINFGVARELNKCPDESYRRMYLQTALEQGATARLVASWVAAYKANARPVDTVNLEANLAPTAPEGETPAICCALCGGSKDPWMLVNVMIHKWEWERIQKIINSRTLADLE